MNFRSLLSERDTSFNVAQEMRIGDWHVEPTRNKLRFRERSVQVEPKTMQVLLFLASHPGEVQSKDRIIEEVWKGTFVTDGVLWNCISELRRIFEDDPRNPQYIETIPKKGYRLKAPVELIADSVWFAVSSRKRWIFAGTFLVFLIALAGSTFMWRDSFPPLPPDLDTSDSKPTVLLTQLENRTGEEVLNGTVEFILEQDLSNSRFTELATRERIEDALRLMKKPQSTPLDVGLGREVALRDGGIDAILAGRIERLGSRYLLGLRIINPNSNEIVAVTNRDVGDRSQMASAARELSQWVQIELAGFSGFERGPPTQFENVTTPSLKALSLFTKGLEIARVRPFNWAAAEQFFRLAIKEDEGFASAHQMLAWVLRSQDRIEEGMKELGRAVELADTVGPAERAFILGSYHQWNGEFEKAIGQYRVLLDLEPGHYWGVRRLITCYRAEGRLRETKPFHVLWGRSRPNDFVTQARVADSLITVFEDRSGAEPFLSQARKLFEEMPELAYAHRFGPWLQLYSSHEKWVDGDIEGALHETRKVHEWLLKNQSKVVDVSRYATFLGYSYLTLGRFHDAEQVLTLVDLGSPLFREGATDSFFHRLIAQIALMRTGPGPMEELDLSKQSYDHFLDWRALGPMILFRIDPELGRSFFNRYRQNMTESHRAFVLGELATLDGRYAEAVGFFRKGMRAVYNTQEWTFPEILLGSESLADVLLRQGQSEEAINALESASRHQVGSYLEGGALWLRVRAKLYEVYAAEGQFEAAGRIKEQLLKYLAYADPDHVILAQLGTSGAS